MGFWQRTRKMHIPAWIFLHAGIILLAFFLKPLAVDTDLYSILPTTQESKKINAAEKKFSVLSNSGMFVLVGNQSFDAAKKAAGDFVRSVSGHPDVDSISFAVDPETYAHIRDFLFRYRYQLQDAETVSLLESGQARQIADGALASVYAPFSFSSLDHLSEDPFLLTERSLQSYVGGALLKGLSLSVKDDVLTAKDGGINYVFVAIQTRAGSTVDTKKSIVARIYKEQDRISANESGTTFANSGVAFHAYESSLSAQNEISVISIVSMLMTILLLFWVYRSLTPILSGVFAIGAGAAAAAAVTLLAFGEIHIFTLVFGTSLIGVSIDYTLHFFTENRNQKNSGDGESTLRHILGGIALGLATTLLSYGVLLLAPFSLLRQMAVFSATGLISTFLTVVLLYPKLTSRVRGSKPLPMRIPELFKGVISRVFSWKPRWKTAALVLAVLLSIPGFLSLKFDNDIRGLYTMSDKMLESEKISARVLNYGSSGWYFIVSGKTADEVLAREEKLTSRLASVAGTGTLGSYMATSSFLPSRDRQSLVYGLVREKLLPLAPAQFAQLGFSDGEYRSFRSSLDSPAPAFLTPGLFFADPLSKMTKNLWIGEVDGAFYSVVLPLHAKNPEFFRDMGKSIEGVYFINKAGDISAALAKISVYSLALLALSGLLIFLLLRFRYPALVAAMVSLNPFYAVLLTLSVLGYAGVSLNVFSVIGLVLVMGIGVDYSIFFAEVSGMKTHTLLAVFLSMLTTVFSFGFLAFSSLHPVSTFGFTVFFGVLFSFICSLLTTPFFEKKGLGKMGDQHAQP